MWGLGGLRDVLVLQDTVVRPHLHQGHVEGCDKLIRQLEGGGREMAGGKGGGGS